MQVIEPMVPPLLRVLRHSVSFRPATLGHDERSPTTQRYRTSRIRGRAGPTLLLVRIVVADNDADALELVATDLRLEGHDVVGLAADGDEAIRLLAESTPDVLVVDYRMPPGPNGLTVARTVRAAQPSVRVILYSNYRDQ